MNRVLHLVKCQLIEGMRTTEAIATFLRNQPLSSGIYWGPEMETQVNVAADDGYSVEGKRNTFTDGLNEWWNIRIPRNAATDPHFHDYELPWPLEPHVEGIGCTGWNWRDRCSRWVAFDFDSITGHAAGVGITDSELHRVREIAANLDYVEVRRSTGGKGLHLYVYLDDIPTANHTEHAALARAVLGIMSTETGFDFASQVDVCGGNMWIWHRKLTAENEGLSVVNSSERTLSEANLSGNWRDHVEVVTRKRSKVRVRGVPDEFEQLAASRPSVSLDEEHNKVIDALMESGFTTLWVSDHNLLQTHTCGLASVHQTLGLRGLFKTLSTGNDPGTPNCFSFPEPSGSWAVYRFGKTVNEHAIWSQEGEWTHCKFNKDVDIDDVARACQGAEDPDRSGYIFSSSDDAIEAASYLGVAVELPYRDRAVTLRTHKDGRLIVEFPRNNKGPDKDPSHLIGWVRKRDRWTRVYNVTAKDKQTTVNSDREHDNIVRHLVVNSGQEAGWALRSKTLNWHREAKDNVRSTLHFMGYSKPEIETILGGAIYNPWKLVNLPFKAEYPGDRQWNRDAAQLVYAPSEEPGEHPHWDTILKHCFCDLDDALRNSEWARTNNVTTGRDYGELWIACLIREPFEPLPYLFLYGEQNGGKSILHEAIALLTTSGVGKADAALTNPTGFNGELERCVLGFIEETNLGESANTAYTRIKDWTTSRTFWVRKMHSDRFPQPNMLHFIQCANHRSACPVFPNDTRIVVMHVPPLKEEIPKSILIDALKNEAPYFMRSIMDRPLPTHVGRLRIPVIETGSKEQVQMDYLPPVEQFIEQCCEQNDNPNDRLPFAEFFYGFLEWLESDERHKWTKHRVSLSLPNRYSTTRSTGGMRVIRGLKWREGS